MAQSCGSVSLLTSADQRRGNQDFGFYYLPKKIMQVAVTYKITYASHYSLDEAHIRRYPRSKRKYSGFESARVIRSIDVGDNVVVTYTTVADTDRAYWLSASNKKGFNSFEVAYLAEDNRILKTINSEFTPSGPGIAVSGLKTLASITSLIATPGLSAPQPLPKDSIVKVVVETTVFKSVDVGKITGTDSLKRAGLDSVRVLRFGKLDLNPADKYTIPEVPVVTVWAKKNVTTAEDAVRTKQAWRARSLNATKPDSTNIVKGIAYRAPFFCDIRVYTYKKDGFRRYATATATKRVSFPQLGPLTVSPHVFSRKYGKQAIAVELDTDAGGITKYKLTRENAGTEWMTSTGDLIKSFGEAYDKRPTGTTALDDLKGANTLLEEKIKQLKYQKTYDSLLSATP